MSVPFMRRIAPFSPTQVSGCQLWLDAADSATISFSSGTSVSQWNDKSGANNNALQATTANQPSTYTSANGLTGMNFGTSNFFRGSFSSPITGTTLSAFVVLNMNASTYNYGRALSLSISNNNDYIGGAGGTNIARNAGNVALWEEAFGGSGTAGPFSINTSTTYIVDSMFDGTTHIAYLNGSNVASVATSTSFSIYLFGIGFQAYQLVSAGSDYWIGYINEVIIYNSVLTEAQRQNIESYLAQKWGLKGNLPNGHPGFASVLYPSSRVQSLTPMTYTYTPTTIAGCFLWLDAKDPTTFAFSSGSNIMSWIDKSGVGNNATSSNGTATYTANSVYFPGSANLITNANITLNNVTIFTLFTYTGTVGYRCLLTGYSNTSSVGGITVVYNNLSGSNFYLVGSYGVANVVTAPLNSASGGSPYIVCFTNTSSVPTLYQNGSNVTNSPVTQVLTGTYKTSIGADVDGLQYVTGNLYEVIVFSNVLTTTQRQNIEGYLAAKWSLQSSLSSDNPYKSNPLSITNIFNVTRPTTLANQYPTPLRNMVPIFPTLYTTTLTYTGSLQTFVVPAGVTSVTLYMWGAGGGTAYSYSGFVNYSGGAGAMVQGVYSVTPASTLYVVVGKGGVTNQSAQTDAQGGGGAANSAGGGGGRSAIQLSSGGADVVVAGGGGGGGLLSASNNGTGGPAYFSGSSPNTLAAVVCYGGTQTAGGAAGGAGNVPGNPGTLKFGGAGTGPGGGGGGGYYGGGGMGNGDQGWGPGGGGSSLIDNLSLIPGQSVLGYNSPNLSGAPNTSSSYYQSNVAAGGVGANATGGNGLVVILYSRF